MRKVAYGFLLRRKQVLLAQKATGENAGLYTGLGGKVNSGESTVAALIREIKEETQIVVARKNLFPSAIITKYVDGEPVFKFYAYTTWIWTGQPRDTAEMINARFFHFGRLPLKRMFPGEQLWLPQVLAGERFSAKVYLDAEGGLEKEISYKHISRYHPYLGPAE